MRRILVLPLAAAALVAVVAFAGVGRPESARGDSRVARHRDHDRPRRRSPWCPTRRSCLGRACTRDAATGCRAALAAERVEL